MAAAPLMVEIWATPVPGRASAEPMRHVAAGATRKRDATHDAGGPGALFGRELQRRAGAPDALRARLCKNARRFIRAFPRGTRPARITTIWN